MDDIEEAVATRFHVKIVDLESWQWSKTLVRPRQITMYLCLELADTSFWAAGT